MFKVFKYKYLALFPIHGDICYHFKYCLKSISIFLTKPKIHIFPPEVLSYHTDSVF